MFGWILLLIIIIIAVVYLAQTGFEWPNNRRNDETPLETLKKRFAKGEISKEEYEERKKELEED